MLIHDLLRASAQKFPSKDAVWHKNQWMTYAEIETRSDRLAWWLYLNGVKRGDRVAILLENSFEYVIAYYGILKSGAVVVSMNTETTPEAVGYLLENSGAVAMVTNGKFHRFIMPALTSASGLRLIVTDRIGEPGSWERSPAAVSTFDDVDAVSDSGPVPVRVIDVDLSAIVYTSGSTGKPKGVMLSHLNTVSNTRSIVEYLDITHDDRIMVVLPFFYVYGKSLLNTHVCQGGSVVIDNRFVYPNTVLDTMERLEVTGFAGVPSTYMILLSNSTLVKRHFPHLRYVTQAGGGMAPAVQERVVKAFAPARLYVMYGATELAPRLTYVPPDRLPAKFGSIGIPVPNADAYVVDEQGNRLGPNQEGQIVGRGSNVMMGYWKDPEATGNAVRGGVYYTGDLGYVDDDGYLFVVGRTTDMIKIGGNRVSAREIEDALLGIEFVAEAAVVGVADDVLGEAAKAFIVIKDPGAIPTDELFHNALITKLPAYKHPKYFYIVKNIPKNESGKVRKSELEKAAASCGSRGLTA